MSWMERRTFGAESIPTLTAMRARKNATGARVGIVITHDQEEAPPKAIRDAIATDLIDATALADTVTIVRATAGRGDALWRSLRTNDASILIWVDGGIRNFSTRVVARLLAPLLLEDSLLFVKGFTTSVSPKSGGRAADHGLARPLLAALFSELGAFISPFGREGAARTSLLRELPFAAGEGVDAGLLIDALDAAGLDALGQADLGGSLHRTRPVSRFDGDVARVILRRAEERGGNGAFADAPIYPLLVRDHATLGPDLPALAGRPAAAARTRLARVAT